MTHLGASDWPSLGIENFVVFGISPVEDYTSTLHSLNLLYVIDGMVNGFGETSMGLNEITIVLKGSHWLVGKEPLVPMEWQ